MDLDSVHVGRRRIENVEARRLIGPEGGRDREAIYL